MKLLRYSKTMWTVIADDRHYSMISQISFKFKKYTEPITDQNIEDAIKLGYKPAEPDYL